MSGSEPLVMGFSMIQAFSFVESLVVLADSSLLPNERS